MHVRPSALLAILMLSLPAGGATVYVDTDATGAGDGSSWTDACTDLQAGADAASYGDVVLVADGTYTNGGGTGPVLQIPDGVLVFGGHEGSGLDGEYREVGRFVATLDGLGTAHHVVIAGNDCLLDGFTVTGGNASGATHPSDSGGGVLADGISDFVLVNCELEDNAAAAYGGAIYIGGPAVHVLNSIIVSNVAGSCGGGVACDTLAASTLVTASTIYGNTVTEGSGTGGGIGTLSGRMEMYSCVVWGNSAAAFPEADFGAYDSVVYSRIGGADPMFVDAPAGDLRLQAGSPCIDAGSRTYRSTTDINGKAFYDDPATPNSGTGQPDYCDIGAHEYGTQFVTVCFDEDNAVESAGVLISPGAVRIWPRGGSDLNVAVASSDESVITVTGSVTIPAGRVSAPIDVTVVDNATYDGHRVVLVTASAAGYESCSDVFTVWDDEKPEDGCAPGVGTPALLGVVLFVTVVLTRRRRSGWP